MKATRCLTSVASALALIVMTGCSGQAAAFPPITGHRAVPTPPTSAYAGQTLHRFYRVIGSEFGRRTGTVTVHAQGIVHGPLTAAAFRRMGNETTLDAASLDGIVNFGTAEYPTRNVQRIRLLDHRSGWRHYAYHGWRGTVRSGSQAAGNHSPTAATATGSTGIADSGGASIVANVPVPSSSGASDASNGANGSYAYQSPGATAAASATGGSIPVPPPGVRIDPNITPSAGIHASRTAKVTAVEQIAQSKLGTPYIWGHNEDRGQYGFDCSNYTEYVYHHSLGYLFTTSSKGQYLHVGVPISTSSMLPGDLVAFDQGGHIGIFVGNGQMIQEGGGLHKVGYLPLRPGSYWYGHISAVKRMF